MGTYNTLDPEIVNCIKEKRNISWGYLERVCLTFDDIYLLLKSLDCTCISISGNPSPRLEKFLKSKEINLGNFK